MSANITDDRSLRIGIMAELTGPCNLQPLVNTACKHLEAAGHEPLVISSGNTTRSELQAWDVLARSQCHGIIVHSDTLSNDQLARMKGSRPNVVLSHIDHYQAGQMAASLFLQLGHKKIAMVAGPSHRYSAQSLSSGFAFTINAASQTDVKLQVLNVDALESEAGADAMQALLDSRHLPSAVFFHHESLAVGGMSACRSNVVNIPDEVSLLSCCHLQLPIHTTDKVCMIRQPLDEIGEFAARRVLELIHEHPPAYSSEECWPAPIADLKATMYDRRSGRDSRLGEPCKLSARERECLEWAAKGKTSWETCQILGITESTIIYHLRNATRKLNAANRLHAVTKALKASLINF